MPMVRTHTKLTQNSGANDLFPMHALFCYLHLLFYDAFNEYYLLCFIMKMCLLFEQKEVARISHIQTLQQLTGQWMTKTGDKYEEKLKHNKQDNKTNLITEFPNCIFVKRQSRNNNICFSAIGQNRSFETAIYFPSWSFSRQFKSLKCIDLFVNFKSVFF